MRPYLAVLKDSFREAFASRVLWILLALTTLVLLAAAPLSLEERKGVEFFRNNIRDWSGLFTKLESQGQAPEPSPGRQVWSRLSPELQSRIVDRQKLPPRELFRVLPDSVVEEFNRLLDDRTLYDEAAWREVEPGKEARELLEYGIDRLRSDDLSRLNRLLLEAAFSTEIARGSSGELQLKYLFWPLGDPLPISRAQAQPVIKTALATIISLCVGILGVLAAILVTAPIIPHTFEPGAIDLLLSKPVSRSLLFLTKFLGGCAFILLNAAYFIVGLWLIAGWRFELWSNRLLLCIPVFLFLFAIYYCVSALAGVLWRNAIVSVVMTVLFWAACFAVGTTKGVIEQLWLAPVRLTALVPAGETLLSVTEQGQVQEWRPEKHVWEEVFSSDVPAPSFGQFMFGPPLVGPVYDAQGRRLLAIETPRRDAGFSLFGPSATTWVGAADEGWTRKKGPAAPAGAAALLVDDKGDLLTLNPGAVFRLKRDARPGAKPDEAAKESFVRFGPEQPLKLQSPISAAVNAATGEVAAWNRGTLIVLERSADGKYSRRLEKKLDNVKEDMAALLALGGTTVAAALADGRVLILDARDLSVQHELRPTGDNPPRFALASPDGRWFAVLFHHRRLWLYDAGNARPATLAIQGQGDVSAVAFDASNRLLTADRGTRVTRYRLDPFEIDEQQSPAMGTLETVYRFAIMPIYTVFPKPNELDNVVQYLLTEQETISFGPNPNSQDLNRPRVTIDVAGPVWSSLAFLAVVLAITCVYVARADF